LNDTLYVGSVLRAAKSQTFVRPAAILQMMKI
jgi:hypothetical protein